MKKILFLFASLVLLVSCDPKIDEFKATPGSADFTKFIVVGHSLPAGYANGALYKSGQESSVSNLIAEQLLSVSGTPLIQPIVNSEYGVLPGKRKLGFSTSCNGITSLGVVPDVGDLEPLGPVGYAVTNLSVPGMKSFHAFVPHYGDFAALPYANPYYCRFATNPANAVVDEIGPLNASFFMLWLGDNDVLSYAIAGGEADSITPLPLFQQAMGGLIQTLTANGAKGVVATVTDVTASPFCTTIPYNGLVLDTAQAAQINYAMNLFGLAPILNYTYQPGPNPFLISDPTSPHPYFKVRLMQPGERVLLTVPQDSLKCGGWGIISPWALMPAPIPDQYVLTSDEVTEIQTAVMGYNETIKALAGASGLAVCDMYENLRTMNSGIIWDGMKLSTKFVTGGVISTDGLHMTPRGNAVAANFFIDAINAKYGSTLPHVNVTEYPGLIFP
jgi:hypothetical protein